MGRARGRAWAWAALAAAVVMWAGGLVTFGLTIVLAPLALGLSVVAWRASKHDSVFWAGVALNALVVLGVIALVIDSLID